MDVFLSGMGSSTFLEPVFGTVSCGASFLREEQFENRSSASSASVPAHSSILASFLFFRWFRVYCSFADLCFGFSALLTLPISSWVFLSLYFLDAISLCRSISVATIDSYPINYFIFSRSWFTCFIFSFPLSLRISLLMSWHLWTVP